MLCSDIMVHKTIALEGLELNAPVGLYSEERKKGVNFVIDISVETLWVEAENNDKIENTVNYERIATLVGEEMKKECHLMEDAAHRIYESVRHSDPNIYAMDVVIRKKDPPIKPGARFSKVELHWRQ